MRKKRLKTYILWCLPALFLIISSCTGSISNKPVEIAKAIPNHVIFIVKANDLQKLDASINAAPYNQVIKEYTWFNTVQENHLALSLVLSKVTASEVPTFPMVTSLHLATATKLNSIHYYPLKLSKKEYNRLLEENFASASKQQWNYENAVFTEILIPETSSKMTLVYTGGILIASPESFLVEDAVKQMHSNNGLLNDETFSKVHNQESNDADLNIWFKFENIKRWNSVFATQEGSEKLAKIKDFASWMVMDLYLSEDGIFMSGLTSTNSKDNLHQFKNKGNCSHSIAEVLPVNVALHTHFAQLPDSLKKYKTEAGISSCWSKVLIEPLKKNEINQWICIFEKGSSEDINQTKIESIGSRILGAAEVHSKREGNYIIVAKNKASINNFNSSFKNKQVLATDEAYLKLNEELKSEANINLYVRSTYTKEAFKSVYEDSEGFEKDFNALKGFNQIAVQFSHQGDIFHTNAHFTFNPTEVSGHTNIVWNSSLDAPMISGPQIVPINNSGAYGVLVQDENFKLYLLGKDGEEIWTKDLDSKWLGKATTLKLYDDNSMQTTFNTELSWFLIDEDANNIAGFPLKFKDKASTGMTVAKLDGKQVAFIGLDNKHLYGYEISGKPLTGWNPKNKVGILNHPVQVVLQNGKEYVTAHADNGTIFIWNEKGKKLASTNFNSDFNSPFYIDKKANPFKLKNVKSNGELVSVNAQGKVGKYKLSASKATQFKMVNVNGDKDPEIILSDGKTVYYYSYSGKLASKVNHKGQFETIDPDVNGFEHIIVNDPSSNNFKILGDKGQPILEPDFYTGSLMDIGHLISSEQTTLVTNGEGNEVICYRISVK